MISRAEQELDLDYTLARRSLFAVLSLLIGCILFGLFDTALPVAGGHVEPAGLGHMTLGVLFFLLAAYLAFPKLSDPKN